MMDIYFHIGLHKTGSTWLKKNLFSNLEYFNLLNDYVRPWEDPIIKKLIFIISILISSFFNNKSFHK